MRGKAQKAGTLQTTPQQVVTVTNVVVEKTVEQQVVVVTNTIVQIQPSNPQVVYVPTYNPYTVYYPPPAYVYNPLAPLVTFGAGVAVGAIIANNCDWHHGGCYHGDVNINVNKNVNRNVNVNRNANVNNARSTRRRDERTEEVAAGPEPPEQERFAQRRKLGPQHGGAGLGFRRCRAFDRQRRSASFHRNCRRAALTDAGTRLTARRTAFHRNARRPVGPRRLPVRAAQVHRPASRNPGRVLLPAVLPRRAARSAA